MNEDLILIKKKYGEKMAHFCRENFANILEIPGLLPKILMDNFDENHYLLDDIYKIEQEDDKMYLFDLIDREVPDIVLFKNFINSIAFGEKEELTESDKTPEELMDEAGYILEECLRESDIQKYKKYYEESETLCTFKGNRLDKCRVFFAVKKNVDSIKRENFKHPKRQDEYGTSVISIQFAKDGTNTLSIKNRYNMVVDNPDATFSNNLDNIIPGLTYSFQKYKGLKQVFTSNRFFELINYVHANDGKFYRYNREDNNIYYCHNNVIIDNYQVKKFDTSRYLIVENFIIDMQEKKIIFYDKLAQEYECIQDLIPTISKIEVKRLENNFKKIMIYGINNEYMELVINKNSRITSIAMKNIKHIGNNFLNNSDICLLRDVYLKDVETIGNNFLSHSWYPENIYAPDLQKVGNKFLAYNSYMEKLYLPNLIEAGDYFLFESRLLTEAYLPKLKRIGNDFLVSSNERKLDWNTLEVLYAPKLINVWKLSPAIRKIKRKSKRNIIMEEDNEKTIRGRGQ